jgi:hypothetical protein
MLLALLLAALACQSTGNTSGAGGAGAGTSGGSGGVGGSRGAQKVLADRRNLPGAIAVDAAYVYWIESDGSLFREPKDGGAIETVGSACKPGAIALDAAFAYCAGSANTLLAFPLAGGAATVLASNQPASDIAVDATHLYWTTYYGVRPGGNNDVSAVASIGLEGTALATLAAAQRVPSSLTVDALHVYWLDLVDAATSSGTNVMSATLDGATVSSIASGSGSSPSIGGSRNKAIAVDATSVYWSETEGAIRSAPRGGGPAMTLADGQDVPGAVVIDAQNLYFATVSGIRQVALGGGNPQDVVAGENAAALALDETRIYWTNPTRQIVASAPK